MDDLELLRQYSREGSQASFSAVVARHVDMVYSAARRQVLSPQLAEEVTQAVFLDLARHAEKLRPDSHLGSWLYVVARRTSVDAIRRESRRQKREQAALEGAALSASSAPWSRVEPVLDEAISSLNESDRKAVLLRFFEMKNFSEIGQALDASEEAAQKRVGRAVDRLRGFLAKRGVTASAAALAAEIVPNVVQAAPAGLAASVSTAIALARPAFQQAAIFQSAHTLAMTSAQKAAVTAIIAVAVAGGLYQNKIIRSQAREIAALTKQTESEQEQIRKLSRDRMDASNKLAALQKENERLKSDSSEQTSNDPTDVALRSWLIRVSQLKQRLQEKPDQKIPELQFLTDEDWLAAARANLTTNEDYRRALAKLRDSATGEFVSMAAHALRKYSEANGGQFPTNLSQLQPDFDNPVDASILQRYAIVPQSIMPNLGVGQKRDQIVLLKDIVDEEYDNTYAFGLNGSGAMGPQPESTMQRMVLNAFMSANNGQAPIDPSQLLPYATTSEQQAMVQRAIRSAGKK